MGLVGFQNRLLPHNAFALNFARLESRIFDMPVASQELNRKLTLVFDGDPVREHIVQLARIGIRWLVFRLDRYLYALCYFRDHLVKSIKFFQFSQ